MTTEKKKAYLRQYFLDHKKENRENKRLNYWRRIYSELSGYTINEIIDMDLKEETLKEFTESLRNAIKSEIMGEK